MPSKKSPSFVLFNHLPAELRLEIWRLSCQPRVVEVRYAPDRDRCLTPTRPPSILQTCKESRDEAIRRCYVRAFGTKTHEPDIYFAPELDILYIPRWGDLGYADTARDFGQFVRDTAQHVRSLAIDHVKPEVRRPWETYSKFCLMRNFPKLRETLLILAAADGDDENNQGGNDWGQIEFVDPRGNWEAIMALMENVKESFNCEVGPDCFVEVDRDRDRNRDRSVGTGTERSSYCGPCLELIPKSKTACGGRGRGRVQRYQGYQGLTAS